MADLYGHFGWSQTTEARNFARLQGVRIVFSTAKFEKKIYIETLNEKKKFVKEKSTFEWALFTKSNSSEPNIYRNRR